jgi:hypothetical protein
MITIAQRANIAERMMPVAQRMMDWKITPKAQRMKR